MGLSFIFSRCYFFYDFSKDINFTNVKDFSLLFNIFFKGIFLALIKNTLFLKSYYSQLKMHKKGKNSIYVCD